MYVYVIKSHESDRMGAFQFGTGRGYAQDVNIVHPKKPQHICNPLVMPVLQDKCSLYKDLPVGYEYLINKLE